VFRVLNEAKATFTVLSLTADDGDVCRSAP
jgi:hypothetical protein